jgi:hypothetical protein
VKGIILPAIVEKVGTRKDNSLFVTIGTNELSPNDGGYLLSLHGKLATVYLSPAEINQKEIDQVDSLEPELAGKTPSQRLRNVLFILFQQNNEGQKDFDSFYKFKMGTIIDHLKTKIQ